MKDKSIFYKKNFKTVIFDKLFFKKVIYWKILSWFIFFIFILLNFSKKKKIGVIGLESIILI